MTTKMLLMALSCLTTLQVTANNLGGGTNSSLFKGGAQTTKQNLSSNAQLPNAGLNSIKATNNLSTSQIKLFEIYQKSKNGEYKNKQNQVGGFDAGGGKVLLCPSHKNKNEIIPIVLDAFEAKKNGYQIDLGPGETKEEKIKFVLDRLSKVAPFRAKVYEMWMSELLYQSREEVENSIFPVTDDLGETEKIPEECEIVQAAFQRDQRYVDIGLKQYVFDKDISKYLSVDSIVELYFHEIVLKEARMRGDEKSTLARKLNYLILSRQVENLTTDEFNLKLKDFGSRCMETKNYPNQFGCGEITEIIYTNEKFNWFGFTFEGLISDLPRFKTAEEVGSLSKEKHISFFTTHAKMNFTNFFKSSFCNFPYTVSVTYNSAKPKGLNIGYVVSLSYYNPIPTQEYSGEVKCNTSKIVNMEVQFGSPDEVRTIVSGTKEILEGNCAINYINWNLQKQSSLGDVTLLCNGFSLKNKATNQIQDYPKTSFSMYTFRLDENGDLKPIRQSMY